PCGRCTPSAGWTRRRWRRCWATATRRCAAGRCGCWRGRGAWRGGWGGRLRGGGGGGEGAGGGGGWRAAGGGGGRGGGAQAGGEVLGGGGVVAQAEVGAGRNPPAETLVRRRAAGRVGRAGGRGTAGEGPHPAGAPVHRPPHRRGGGVDAGRLGASVAGLRSGA